MKRAFGFYRIGRIGRGLCLIVLGALMLRYPVGCSAGHQNKKYPDEGEKIVYSDTQYRMVQGAAIHKPSPAKGREYVFIPLRLKISGGTSVIFSTRTCITAYALPSCEACFHSSDAVTYGKDNIEAFRLFDGILFSGRETSGWLAFDLPEGSESVHVDFSTGMNEDDMLSFDCKI